MATLPVDIDDFTTVIADNYPAAGDAVGPNLDDLLRLQGASIADLRDITREAFVTIEDKRFAGAGDDATNNITPLTDAMAAGAVVQFGTGTYRFTVNSGTAIGVTVANITRLVGQGKGRTTLKFVLSGTTVTSLFQISTGRLELDGLTVEVVNPDGAQVIFFNGAGLSGFRASRCKFDGAVTHTGTTVTHTAYGINFPTTGTHEDIQVVDCECTRIHWFVQKTNASTSTQRRLKFIRCDFSYFYRTPLAFNTPSGIIDDILIDGCTFRENQGQDSGFLNAFYVGSANATNLRVVNNRFTGNVEQAIHFEEGVHGASVSNNLVEVDGVGIAILDNDNGGFAAWAEDFTITNNVFKKAGTLGLLNGIWLINDASADTPAKKGIIANNFVYGYEYGINDDTVVDDSVAITGNTAHTCTYGFRSTGSTRAYDANRSVSCTYGVNAVLGGVFRNHGFIACTNTALEEGRGIILINPYFEFATTEPLGAASTTNYTICTLDTRGRISGTMTAASTTSNETDTDFAHYTVLWDGTTCTNTSVLTLFGGDTALTIEQSGSNLIAKVTATTARDYLRVVCHFNGVMRFEA